jgi:excinuclease ABC subunit C
MYTFDSSNFPHDPGVYLMKNRQGRIIYVGKAKDLRRRVASYFRSENRLTPKVRVMMPQVENIDILRTGTEKEALLLEASLIKKHRPKYNVVLRDDKQYILFKLDRQTDYPALRLTRKVVRDGSVYFGPFTSAFSARQTMKLINRIFPLRKCGDKVFRNRVRPCLQHHIGRCLGPCCLPVSVKEYREVVRQVELFLSGRSRDLVAGLNTEMEAAAEALEFEKAALLRDQIRSIESVTEKQAAVVPGGRDMDIIGVQPGKDGLHLGMVFVRRGSLLDGRNFSWPGVFPDSEQEAAEIVSSFLLQFYGPEKFIPDRVVLPFPLEDPAVQEVLTDLRGKRVWVSMARDHRERRLVEIAAANAVRDVPEAGRSGLDDRLGRALGLGGPVTRIECVDASHLGGEGMRVGKVVFENGTPRKEDYRVYTFPEMEGEGDDYKALAAFVQRRIVSGPPWPDLLLVDGGRGQLSMVERALLESGGENLFDLASIAKGETRRAGEMEDRIFRPGRKNPVNLKSGSPELLFLQQVRDAAHRFVISRLRRHKRTAMLDSSLERLPGVGPATAGLLWDRFGSVQAMREATVGELREIPGIGPKKAEQLQKALQRVFG